MIIPNVILMSHKYSLKYTSALYLTLDNSNIFQLKRYNFGVDAEGVWQIIQDKIPELMLQIKKF